MPKALYASMCHMANDTKINGMDNSPHAIIYVLGGQDNLNGNRNIYEYNTTENKWNGLGNNAALSQSRSYTRAEYIDQDNII